MLQKQIESQFTDPHGGNAEMEKHSAAAAETLGANPVLIKSTTSGVLNKEETETVGFKLTTVWQARDAGQA